jgi:beta-lactamase superfamily II metal-dependent hydrolase
MAKLRRVAAKKRSQRKSSRVTSKAAKRRPAKSTATATATAGRRASTRASAQSRGATAATASNGAGGLMTAPASGVKVRMYRQGHGDCFLLAFAGSNGEPVHMLIDCGYKPGSNVPYGLHAIDDIVADIKTATGGHLDVVAITHEHQDHVNGFWRQNDPYFGPFTVGEAWFAWTEDPKDDLANELRERYHDQLLGLVAARNQLAASGPAMVGMLDSLLQLELGVSEPTEFAAAAAAKKKNPEASVNKQGMRLIKDKATAKNTRFIRPHEAVMTIPGVDGVRVYALGPPHDAGLIADEDPQGSEAFPGQAMAMARHASFYAAAQAADDGNGAGIQPFARRFGIPKSEAFKAGPYAEFFKIHYGGAGVPASRSGSDDECADNADWRRIDTDWLRSAEELALVLNQGINNTSLVLAFELVASKKVLLFVGDAQRGNWKSWTAGEWKDGDRKVTVRDLMARTVLYKVGHHGSHNATLNGTVDSDYPCLAWMGLDKAANEFTAMITAVHDWAYAVKPKPWRHPLPSIKDALMKKAANRVFQTDTPKPAEPQNTSDPDWQAFIKRTTIDPNGLYFEYEVSD